MRYQARYRWALLLALLLSSYDFYARVMPRTLLKVHAFAAPRAQRAPLSAPVLPAAALAQLAGHFSPGTTADEPGLAASAAAAQAQAQAQAQADNRCFHSTATVTSSWAW